MIDGDQKFAIDLGCFEFDPKNDTETAYRMATSGNMETQRIARNRLEAVLINQANLVCEQEKGAIYGNKAATSGILDFFASGLSITSTIVGGEQAKSILSGLAGLSTATRTNIDANVYQNQLVSAITKVMDAELARILTIMEAKRGSSVADYSTDDMIRRANEYHQGCSFQKGVQLLLDAAVNKEGVDRIIEGINLRTAVNNLREQRDLLDRLGTPEADAKVKELDTKLGELILQQAQNAEGASSVTVETGANDGGT